MLKVSKVGVDLCKEFEGFFSKAYRCPAGVWTVGYGTTMINGRPVNSNDTMTLEHATQYLLYDLQKHLDSGARYIKPEIARRLNQNQIDAIASFVYNIGAGGFSKSSFLKLLNQGDFVNCSERMLLWNKGGGKILRGLVRRRAAEKKLFDTPMREI